MAVLDRDKMAHNLYGMKRNNSQSLTYDIGNTSTKLIILNFNDRSSNRIRGYGEYSKPRPQTANEQKCHCLTETSFTCACKHRDKKLSNYPVGHKKCLKCDNLTFHPLTARGSTGLTTSNSRPISSSVYSTTRNRDTKSSPNNPVAITRPKSAYPSPHVVKQRLQVVGTVADRDNCTTRSATHTGGPANEHDDDDGDTEFLCCEQADSNYTETPRLQPLLKNRATNSRNHSQSRTGELLTRPINFNSNEKTRRYEKDLTFLNQLTQSQKEAMIYVARAYNCTRPMSTRARSDLYFKLHKELINDIMKKDYPLPKKTKKHQPRRKEKIENNKNDNKDDDDNYEEEEFEEQEMQVNIHSKSDQHEDSFDTDNDTNNDMDDDTDDDTAPIKDEESNKSLRLLESCLEDDIQQETNRSNQSLKSEGNKEDDQRLVSESDQDTEHEIKMQKTQEEYNKELNEISANLINQILQELGVSI